MNGRLGANGALRNARDTAIDALGLRVRGLIDELDLLLTALDPRWYAFGLNPPGAPATPEIPDGLVITVGPNGSGTIYLDWDDAPRAERYRVWQKADNALNWESVATVDDSDATLSGLAVGFSGKLRVTALNDAGESAAGEAVAVLVG